ncbi:MAG: thiamine pyrophosphate-binding protein [Halobacteriaceae archaeon]
MTSKRGGEHVHDALLDAGVDLLVGLPGTQTLPLDRTVVERGELRYVMARQETAIPHIAWGYTEAGGGMAATAVVPGPGDTNAMHGLKNAFNDSVPMIHMAAEVNPEDRGKQPIHEIERDTVDTAVKDNVFVDQGRAVRAAIDRAVATAQTPPKGPVRVGVPNRILAAEVDAAAASIDREEVRHDTDAAYDAAADALAGAEKPVVYVGGGARRSPDGRAAVEALVDAIEAPVLTSYKGKGVFPEHRPEWVGTTGGHLPSGGRRVLAEADVVIALGTAFDGVSTDHWELPMGETLVHVDVDERIFDAAYEADIAIPDDVAHAAYELVARSAGTNGWGGARIGTAVRSEYRDALATADLLDDGAPATTPAVLEAVREAVPDEGVVVTDVGGFRLWAFQTFPAHGPERYVTAGSWAGMGVGLPAAIGATIANPETPVVCLTGDGGLLMCIEELHTAAGEGVDLTVVVFDNADYGTISKSPEIEDYGGGRQFAWEAPDFPAIAEGFGCRGDQVETPDGVRETVEAVIDRPGVDLIDVPIDRSEPSVADAGSYESTVEF